MKEPILALTRQLSQIVGTSLMTHGYIIVDDTQTFVGLSVSLVTILWSVCKNRGVKICQD